MVETSQATRKGNEITPVRHDDGGPKSSETDGQGRSAVAQPAAEGQNEEGVPAEGQ